MRSLESRLSRLETAARRTRSELISDEEVINALKRWDWDGRHLDTMFRLIEPGMLGGALIGSAGWRRQLVTGKDCGIPIAEIDQMCFLMALGSDIPHPVRRELEVARRRLTKPLRHNEKERTSSNGLSSIHDAQAGLVRRLFQKHGLQRLQTTVRELDNVTPLKELDFIRRFVPRVDRTRWNRMVEMVDPLETHSGHIGLLARSADGRTVWSLDRKGQLKAMDLWN